MTSLYFFEKLFTDGILPGVGSVLSFVPTIAAAIFIITLLRECGIIRGGLAYFITGFSCSTAAILTCESIPNKRQQHLTALLIPYMSCSAKLPIYVMLSTTFFPNHPLFIIALIYLLGIALAFVFASLFKAFGLFPAKRTASHSKRFRRPDMLLVIRSVTACCADFFKKAFTVIPAASAIVWLLKNLDQNLNYTINIENSLLANTGRFLTPAFEPLGFDDWRAVTALIAGLAAKEAVVSTFAVLGGAGTVFTPASAFSFMAFCLLYAPCPAGLIAMRKLTGNYTCSILMFVTQTILAWVVSFLIFYSIKAII